MSTRDLAIISLAAGLSAGLSLLRLFQLPQGGSVTLEAIPIFYVALLRGPASGLAAGALSGVAQLLIPPPPFIVHPAQAVLDYPLAMAACGVAGVVRVLASPSTKSAAGYAATAAALVLGGSGKFVLHVLSGVIFFAEYAPAGQNLWAYSAIYNASHVLPQLALGFLLLPSLIRRAQPRGT